MDRIRIVGGRPLCGTIRISGAKNSALKLMAASLLTRETLFLTNVPNLADIDSMAGLLEYMGVTVEREGSSMRLNAAGVSECMAPYDLVRKMRASILVLGPLLAHHGKARVSLPGGCAIGTRPVDMHLTALEQMGAAITLDEGYVNAVASAGLQGANILFPKVSVGATENLLMASTLAHGETLLANVAREPEIGDLARCLQAMGAQIEGIGTGRLKVAGVDRLHGADYTVMPDRIEAGTYAIAAVLTGGDVVLEGVTCDILQALLDVLAHCGAEYEEVETGIRVWRSGPLKGVDVMTEPFPGFPTDLQAQFMTLMTVADGAAMVTETIFENRFMHVPELARMGANINVHQASALVRGVPKLKGAPVMATDLRASVSLVLAGLVAEGETIVNRVYHLDRGYEHLEAKLRACGVQIERLHGESEMEAAAE
jgi:UDP-N-acetylglucosamine 1-carboxyvinyltransferase